MAGPRTSGSDFEQRVDELFELDEADDEESADETDDESEDD